MTPIVSKLPDKRLEATHSAPMPKQVYGDSRPCKRYTGSISGWLTVPYGYTSVLIRWFFSVHDEVAKAPR